MPNIWGKLSLNRYRQMKSGLEEDRDEKAVEKLLHKH